MEMSVRKLGSCFRTVLFALCLIPSAYAATTAAPEFELPTGSGKINLAGFKGKVVYLDFWASWCAPCRKSFPWMNEMERRYDSDGLVVVAVNLDKERDLAEQFLHDVPARFTVAYDPEGKVAERYGVQGMPSSILIGRDGKVIGTHLGFRTDDISELEKTLKTALGQK